MACGLGFRNQFSFGYAKIEMSIRNELLMIHFILHYIKIEQGSGFSHTHSEVEGELETSKEKQRYKCPNEPLIF